MKFKRIFALILALALIMSLGACNTNGGFTSETGSTASSTAPTAEVVEVDMETELDILNWGECGGYVFDESQPVKNIILMIGDGMGENIIKNVEIVKGDKFATGYMPHSCYVGTDSLTGVTDSAASATAISCGVKTYNKYIGVDENGKPVETIIEFAKARGMKTGLVATQTIPHATPAAMVAHDTYRNQFNAILRDMINARVDVLFGGGGEYAETTKMKARIDEAGYKYITTSEELDTLTPDAPAFGCFAYFDLDASRNPSLTNMTTKALELLQGDEGFFLMVEASHIDIYEAEQDMDKTMMEMQAFDKCIDYVLNFAAENPGTLVLVTADHETGGVTVPESGLPEDVNNSCFTSEGEHTNADVLLFAAGAQADKLLTDNRIENTQIAEIMRKVLNDTYGEAPVKLLND